MYWTELGGNELPDVKMNVYRQHCLISESPAVAMAELN